MIALLSPAKSMDFENARNGLSTTDPVFLNEAEYLIEKLKKLSPRQIGKLMSINPELADLNHERFQTWSPDHHSSNTRAAVFSFTGEVYRGLQAADFSDEDVSFANDHLAILSGLYGILRPLDHIQPYRLEMGSKFKVTEKQSNIYKYWGDKISGQLNNMLKGHDEKVILNLASNEYVKAIDKKSLKFAMVDCTFLDAKNGEYKTVMTWAKKARGMMAREIVKQKVDKLNDVKGLTFDGYEYNASMSSESEFAFTRG